mmetsp:Transcript_2920/g.6764  ORF Transcript_2920/g.6764 Transcript_2920/m.6764 type:complete len:205 (-) Transcript_2920:455-1069(-)
MSMPVPEPEVSVSESFWCLRVSAVSAFCEVRWKETFSMSDTSCSSCTACCSTMGCSTYTLVRRSSPSACALSRLWARLIISERAASRFALCASISRTDASIFLWVEATSSEDVWLASSTCSRRCATSEVRSASCAHRLPSSDSHSLLRASPSCAPWCLLETRAASSWSRCCSTNLPAAWASLAAPCSAATCSCRPLFSAVRLSR